MASHRSQISALAHINLAYLALGVLLEIAALVAYTQLTHSVLPHGGPSPAPPVPHQPLDPGPQPRVAPAARHPGPPSATGC